MFKNLFWITIVFVCVSCGGMTETTKTIEPSKSIKLEGKISFWEQGVTGELVTLGNVIAIDESGNFSGNAILTAEEEDTIEFTLAKDFSTTEDCLTSSNPNSKYVFLSALDVFKGDRWFSKLWYQTDNFNFQVGEVYKTYLYFTEDTTLSGNCVQDVDDDSQVVDVFNDIEVKKGWNTFFVTLTEMSENSETYLYELSSSTLSMRWEIEAIPLDEFDSESDHGFLNINYEYSELGTVISEVFEDGVGARAGLQQGDVIKAVDGLNVVGMNYGSVIALAEGKAGTTVKLSILRDSETLEFEIVRTKGDFDEPVALETISR